MGCPWGYGEAYCTNCEDGYDLIDGECVSDEDYTSTLTPLSGLDLAKSEKKDKRDKDEDTISTSTEEPFECAFDNCSCYEIYIFIYIYMYIFI